MNRLEDHLDRAGARLRKATSDLAAPPLGTVEDRARRRAVLAFAGAAAVVLLAVGGVALLPRGAGDDVADTTVATSTTAAAPDWATGRPVLSTSPRVVQALPDPESTETLPPDDELPLLPIEALTAADLDAIGAYEGSEPIVAVGELAGEGRLFVIPPGWSGAPDKAGTCYLTVGSPSFSGVLCDLSGPLLDVSPSESIRLVGPVPPGTSTFEARASGPAAGCDGSVGCPLASPRVWQRTRGGHAFVVIRIGVPASATWTARDPGGATLATQEIPRIAVPGTCSASGLSTPETQPGLPDEIAALRSRIADAAIACDYGELESLAADGFVSSFGGSGIELLRDAESRGDPLLATLVRILEMPFADKTYDDGSTYFYWPSAFVYDTWDDVPEADREALRPVYSDDDFAGFAEFGGYIGWRVGITAEGEWRFFVAGD